MQNAVDLAEILRDLLAKTRASRSTLRLDLVGLNFPVVAEAVQGGVASLGGDHSIDQRNLGTVRFLFETHELLIQPDVSQAETPPPQALIDVYGVQAQVLSPITLGGTVLGWISVHQVSRTRDWSDADLAAVREATALVARYFTD